MKYRNFEPEVTVVLDLVRAAHNVAKTFPRTQAGDFLQHLDEAAGDWALSLAEIVIEHEQKRAATAARLRRWRRSRARRR